MVFTVENHHDGHSRSDNRMAHRAVFVDRDGTILEHYDYLTHPDQVRLLANAARALCLLRNRGYKLVLITNQSAVGRGMMTEDTLTAIHDRFQGLLSEQGAYLDSLYYCPDHPEAAIDTYRKDSPRRKPEPGMILEAAAELDIDLSQSWMVGDDDRDILAGQAAGCRTILLTARGSSLVQRGAVQSDYVAVNLLEAANLVIRYQQPPAATVADPPAPDIAETPLPIESDAAESPEPDPATTADPPAHDVTDSSKNPTPDEPLGDDPDVHETPDDDAPLDDETPDEAHDDPILKNKLSHPLPARRGPGPVHKIIHKKKRSHTARAKHTDHDAPSSRDLLAQLLREVRSIHRQQHYGEFSVGRLLAGIIQMLVFACLFLAFWFGNDPQNRSILVGHCLTLAAVFQMMTLTLLMMRK